MQPFYKQNAGLFAFLVFFMVAAVGRANEVGLLEYHFTLMKAMLTDIKFLVFVLIIWMLYALKCGQFMIEQLRRKEYAFIFIMNIKKSSFVFDRMMQVQFMLLLPVTLYALICVWIGIMHQWYASSMTIASFILTALLAGAWRYQRVIRKNGIMRFGSFIKINACNKVALAQIESE